MHLFSFAAHIDNDLFFFAMACVGVEEEVPGPRNPCFQVSQGDQRLLLSPGPKRGHGVLGPAGGMEAEILVADGSAESVAEQ
jgi:hypothetical protein